MKYAIYLWTKDHVVKQKVGTNFFWSGSFSSLLNVWFTANLFPFMLNLNTYMKTWTFKKCYVSDAYHILTFLLITNLDIRSTLLWFLQLQEGIKGLHPKFLGCFYNIRLQVLCLGKRLLSKFYRLTTEKKLQLLKSHFLRIALRYVMFHSSNSTWSLAALPLSWSSFTVFHT